MRDKTMRQWVNQQEATYPDGKVYHQAKIVLKPDEVDDLLNEVTRMKDSGETVMIAFTWDLDRIKPNTFGGESTKARVSVFKADPDWKPKDKQGVASVK